MLATLSPYTIRSVTTQVAHVGRISGLIIAASTVGSIVGVFVSGYVLIDRLGISAIFRVTGALTASLGVLCFASDRWFEEKAGRGQRPEER